MTYVRRAAGTSTQSRLPRATTEDASQSAENWIYPGGRMAWPIFMTFSSVTDGANGLRVCAYLATGRG